MNVAADGAPESEAPAAAPKKPRKTTRTRRTTKKAADAAEAGSQAPSEPGAPLSPEVEQARALAQVSQASVARRQRRAAARAEDTIAAPDDTAAPAPAPSEAVVDPALRPHRRGRKPKAYVEAEKAALAAAAAQQQADAAASGAPASDASEELASDNRPGRARRARTRKASGEAAGKDKQETTPAEALAAEANAAAAADAEKAAEGAPEANAGSPEQAGGKGAKKAGGKAAGKSSGKPAEDGADAAPAEGQQGRSARRTHATRRTEHGGQDRREHRANGRKQRNNRFSAPTEPSLSRDDLAAMKVAELREKAKELDIDTASKKKAELVEEIYTAAARAEGFRDVEGVLDIANDGYGHIRVNGYSPSRDDAFVPANLIRAARLRTGDYIVGTVRPSRANDKYPGLAKIKTVNGLDPEQIRNRPKFSDLTPIYPNEPLKMEHGKDSITGRAIDIVAPVGKGQRGLIVSPPKAGKTTILKKICQSIAINNPEVHVICLLVDERPEEVTDMQRSIAGEVVASTFDMPADNHTRVSELVIERAKRIVELGGDVVVVLDSITRLARAYNLAAPASGRILSGGVDSAALYPPKRFLGAARNIENGGSLTILASALVDTGSKMDEVIFEEFKGTGNMELKLDRDLADRRIFPAIDPVASGTRNEDLLIDEQMRPFVWGIRRVLAGMSNTERCASAFIKGLRGTNSNREFLIRSAKRAQEHGEAI